MNCPVILPLERSLICEDLERRCLISQSHRVFYWRLFEIEQVEEAQLFDGGLAHYKRR